ncbi:MAG TPA: glutathione peroxidase [Chitinophagaceae bacterium]|nr:glutathione peroxidase [Chitinophagaceae bacterium]
MRKFWAKLLYKLLLVVKHKRNMVIMNKTKMQPVTSFYTLRAVLNSGKELAFDQLKGKKVLIVNTASECGYTPQYEELEELYNQYKDTLIILGFPSNDFGAQEPGSDEEIARFCKVHYGVTFPIMQKSSVIKSSDQNPVFAWLTNSALNGWNTQQPEWNFNKYLVNENGELTAYFPSAASPLSDDILEAVEN